MLPEEIKQFVERFEKLPSIGPRQATRLAFRLIGEGKEVINSLLEGLEGLKDVGVCSQCFFVHTNKDSLCSICNDSSRVADTIMIVEKETDLISIEQTNQFKGLYLILGELTRSGVLEPWQKSRIQVLKKYIEKNNKDKKVKEIILALNHTTYGDLNAALLSKGLKNYAGSITRLGRGIPTGGEIEFADIDTLSSSLQRRQ